RSIVGCRDEHASDQCLSGYTRNESKQIPGGRPSLGSYLSKLEGPVDKSIPPFVGLSPKTGHAPWGNPGGPRFLGLAHSAFSPFGNVKRDLALAGNPLGQLGQAKALLRRFDNLPRDLDASGNFEAMDEFTQRAFDVLTSSKLAEALDVTREPAALREKYGR